VRPRVVEPLYETYPYLATRLVPTLYHLIPLPESLDEASLLSFARHQWLCNQLPTCLVLAPDRCVYFETNGTETPSGTPPQGGIRTAGRLKLARGLQQGTWWEENNERLIRDLDGRHKQLHGRFLLGDLRKGGRPATAEELRTFKGVTTTGIPLGLTQCPTCGDWKGKCVEGLAPTASGDRLEPCLSPFPSNGDSPRGKGDSPLVLTVSCRCDNDNRCASCYGLLYEGKLNANYYDSSSHSVIHVPGFLACGHRCHATQHQL